MVHADHRRHHRQVLADARGLILLTGATGYIGSRLLRELEAGGCNRRLNERGVGVMTTAVLATYYPPRRRLTVSYAGHPTGWLFRADTGAWARLCEPVPPPQKPGLIDLPMGIGFTPTYNRHRFRVSPGDRMVLFTEGVLETTSPDDTPFDTHGIESLLNRDRQLRGPGAPPPGGPPRICGVRRTGTRRRDVSARGIRRRPSLWLVFKHRLLRLERR